MSGIMGLRIVDVYVLVLLGLGVVSLVANLVLVWVVRSVRDKGYEVRLAVGLAGVDTALAVLAIINFILQKVDKDSVGSLCKIKGPLDFVLVFASMLLVAGIGIERSSIVVSKFSFGTWAGLTFIGLLHLTAVMAGVVSGEFTVSASGLDCALDVTNSSLAAFVLFTFGSSMLVLLLVTLYSYFGILMYVGNWDLIEADPNSNRKRSTQVVARILSIATVYLLLIGPCSILIISESLQLSSESRFTSLFITFILATISIVNPCLILFVHTTVYHQLLKKLSNLISPIN